MDLPTPSSERGQSVVSVNEGSRAGVSGPIWQLFVIAGRESQEPLLHLAIKLDPCSVRT